MLIKKNMYWFCRVAYLSYSASKTRNLCMKHGGCDEVQNIEKENDSQRKTGSKYL